MLPDWAWAVLEPAIKRADEGVTRQSLEDGLRTGQYLLFTHGRSAAVAVPMGKTLRIGLAGGILSEVQEIVRQIESFAQEQSYTKIQTVGRDWRRALDGYRKTAVILEKDL